MIEFPRHTQEEINSMVAPFTAGSFVRRKAPSSAECVGVVESDDARRKEGYVFGTYYSKYEQSGVKSSIAANQLELISEEEFLEIRARMTGS